MFKLLFLLSVVMIPGSVFTQTIYPPEYGTLNEIKGKTRVYPIAKSIEDRDGIIKELTKDKSLTIAADPKEAELFLEYEAETIPNNFFSVARGQLTAYYYREGQKRIVWTESSTGAGYKATQPKKLSKKFLSSLKKAK